MQLDTRSERASLDIIYAVISKVFKILVIAKK